MLLSGYPSLRLCTAGCLPQARPGLGSEERKMNRLWSCFQESHLLGRQDSQVQGGPEPRGAQGGTRARNGASRPDSGHQVGFSEAGHLSSPPALWLKHQRPCIISHTFCWSGVPEGFGQAVVATGPPCGHSLMLAGAGTVRSWPGVSFFVKSQC